MILLLAILGAAAFVGIGYWVATRRSRRLLGSDVTRQWLHENSYTKDGDRS